MSTKMPKTVHSSAFNGLGLSSISPHAWVPGPPLAKTSPRGLFSKSCASWHWQLATASCHPATTRGDTGDLLFHSVVSAPFPNVTTDTPSKPFGRVLVSLCS